MREEQRLEEIRIIEEQNLKQEQYEITIKAQEARMIQIEKDA